MTDVTDGIRDYLASGGLFNPELMDHQGVRDLVIKCRDEIERLREAHEECSWQLRNVLDSRDARDAEIERLRSELDRTERVASLTAAASSVAGEALRKMDEANAEIERLRSRLSWFETAGGVAVTTKVHEQQAEIERLRSDLAATSDSLAVAAQALNEEERECEGFIAEIERLRQEKADILAAKEIVFAPPAIPEGFVIDQLRKTIISLYADIARIREEGQKDYEGMREFQRKFIDADHEIERLREENSTFSDSLAAKADRIDRLGETAARQVAEIERLRAQLAATEAGAVSFRDTAEAEFTKLRGTLREIRIRLHAAGRRPEECYEMSLIDEALGETAWQPSASAGKAGAPRCGSAASGDPLPT